MTFLHVGSVELIKVEILSLQTFFKEIITLFNSPSFHVLKAKMILDIIKESIAVFFSIDSSSFVCYYIISNKLNYIHNLLSFFFKKRIKAHSHLPLK